MRQRPTLVALHGGPGLDHTSFKPGFGALADVAQIVYVDHRGQGRSDRSTPDRWTFAQWADDVVALCDALGIELPVVYGVSFGGMVALHYAVRHPDHPGRVILDSTTAAPDLPAALAVFERLGGPAAVAAAQAFWDNPDDRTLADYYAVCMPLYARHPAPDRADVAARGLAHANFALFRHWAEGERRSYDLRGSLGAIAAPVLLLAGEDDPITPVTGARELAAALGPDRCRLEVFADCGHEVWRDQPDRAFAAMRAFLAGP